MGYTHYWNLKEKVINDVALSQINKTIKKYKDIIQLENDNDAEPVVSEKAIIFNGIGKDGHETFYLENGEGFCKTNMKPYDIVVCEVLLVMKYNHNERFELLSDGFWVTKDELINKKLFGNWDAALNNVKKDFGIEFKIIPVINGQYYKFGLIPKYK